MPERGLRLKSARTSRGGVSCCLFPLADQIFSRQQALSRPRGVPALDTGGTPALLRNRRPNASPVTNGAVDLTHPSGPRNVTPTNIAVKQQEANATKRDELVQRELSLEDRGSGRPSATRIKPGSSTSGTGTGSERTGRPSRCYLNVTAGAAPEPDS
jgi:hypothetical protein